MLLHVAAQLPSIDFSNERGLIRQATIKALAVKNADFDFSHIEPTGMFRCVVEDNPSQQCFGFFDVEHFFEAFAKMSVEIVHHKMDASRRGINLLEQVLYESHEVGLSSMIGDHDCASSAFWFDCYE